jgi:hypothetical protein
MSQADARLATEIAKRLIERTYDVPTGVILSALAAVVAERIARDRDPMTREDNRRHFFQSVKEMSEAGSIPLLKQ